MWILVLLALDLPRCGYWYGDSRVEIGVSQTPAIADPLVAHYGLSIAGVAVITGSVPLDANGCGRVVLELPAVRVRTVAEFEVRLVHGTTVIETETTAAVLFPDVLTDLVTALQSTRIFVCGGEEGLASTLRVAGVHCTAVESPGHLLTANPDIVIIEQGRIADDPFSEAPIRRLAQSGARVLVLAQPRVTRLFDLAATSSAGTAPVIATVDHPLFRDLPPDILGQIASRSTSVPILQAKSGETTVLAWLDEGRMDTSKNTPEKRAVIIEKRMGAGVVIAIQLPIDPAAEDPRAAILIRNALNYLASPMPDPPALHRRDSLGGEDRRASAEKLPEYCNEL